MHGAHLRIGDLTAPICEDVWEEICDIAPRNRSPDDDVRQLQLDLFEQLAYKTARMAETSGAIEIERHLVLSQAAHLAPLVDADPLYDRALTVQASLKTTLLTEQILGDNLVWTNHDYECNPKKRKDVRFWRVMADDEIEVGEEDGNLLTYCVTTATLKLR
eukprot:599495-Prymnesium_polylepis.1